MKPSELISSNRVALVISSYQPSDQSSDLLRTALRTMVMNGNGSDIFVFDVGSPRRLWGVKPYEFPEVNFFYSSHTPRSWDNTSRRFRFARRALLLGPPRNGSIANGWTLDWAYEVIRHLPYTHIMTLQMDVMFTDKTLVPELLSKFDETTAAVGVRVQKNLGGAFTILHSLGCMWKKEALEVLPSTFQPYFPDFDVGEKLCLDASSLGWKLKHLEAARPASIANLAPDGSEALGPRVDRAYSSGGSLLFLHLGRGIPKTKRSSDAASALKTWHEVSKKFAPE